jgi:hypothetical protein
MHQTNTCCAKVAFFLEKLKKVRAIIRVGIVYLRFRHYDAPVNHLSVFSINA